MMAAFFMFVSVRWTGGVRARLFGVVEAVSFGMSKCRSLPPPVELRASGPHLCPGNTPRTHVVIRRAGQWTEERMSSHVGIGVRAWHSSDPQRRIGVGHAGELVKRIEAVNGNL